MEPKPFVYFSFPAAIIEHVLCRVFALRIGTRNKRWDSFRKRYTWDRFPSAVWPKLPHKTELAKRVREQKYIPWPKPERREPNPGLSDTTHPGSIV